MDERGAAEAGSDGRRKETALERTDRNLLELLNELRVAIPGIQVLFAFLLVLPFNARFEEVTEFERVVYLVTLMSTAIAAVLIMAPSIHHRLEFRKGLKEETVRDANRPSILDLTALAVAMVGAVMLVVDFVAGAGTMIACVAGLVVLFALVWYLMPLRRLRADKRHGA